MFVNNIPHFYKTLPFQIETKSYNYKIQNGTLRTLDLEKPRLLMDTNISHM